MIDVDKWMQALLAALLYLPTEGLETDSPPGRPRALRSVRPA